MICCARGIRLDSASFGKPCTKKATLTNSDGDPVCHMHVTYTKERYEEQNKIYQDKISILENNNLLLEQHPNDIPYKNHKGEIIGFALVSEEDYDNVRKYNWTLKEASYKSGQTKQYVFTRRYMDKNASLNMHELILGKPPDGHVIDHLDNNGLNNRRDNLRFATYEQNSQNRKKKANTKSKYIGVYICDKTKKWNAQYSKTHLGTFDIEEDAGKQYDTFVLLKLGKDSKTNGLVSYDEVQDLNIDDILPKKKERNLPLHISYHSGKFVAQIMYKKTLYYKSTKTLEEAVSALEVFEKTINDIKSKELEDHYKQDILLNPDGQAILPIKNKEYHIIEYVPVPKDKWHELMLYSWHKNDKYYSANIKGKLTMLHRYLLNAKENEVVDHINYYDVSNNTEENLRISNGSNNSHNKKKKDNASSKYFGVSILKRRWLASICKNGVNYTLGIYNIEVKAAIAYNIKAKELYGEFARLNTIPDEDIVKYEKEVIEKMTTPRKTASIYNGVTWNKQLNKWQAIIIKKGVKYYLGVFTNEIDAAKAYNKKAMELDGETSNRLNKFEE